MPPRFFQRREAQLSRTALPMIALIALGIIKFAALVVFGPQGESDSPVYLQVADLIVNDRSWWRDAGLQASWMPLTVFRPLGYSGLLALGQVVAGKAQGPYFVMILQILFGLLATAWVWRVARGVLGSGSLALLAAAGFAFSVGFLYDQSVMSDSLFNSAYVLMFAIAAAGLLEQRPATLRAAAVAGLLAMFALSLRGVTTYLLVFLVPVWGLWLWRSRGPRLRAAAIVAIVLLPAAALGGAVMAWNHARTGKAFYAMTVPVPIQPLVMAAGRGHDIFDGDTVIDREVRDNFRTYKYEEILQLSERLFRVHGLTAPEAYRLEIELYLRAWRRHPGAMIDNTLRNITHHLINNFFNVIDVFDQSIRIASERRILPPLRELRAAAVQNFDLLAGLLLVAVMVLRVTSLVLFAVFIIGLPAWLAVRLHRDRALDPPGRVLLAGWLCAMGYVLLLCALHFALRFLPAVLPWGLIGALAVAQALAIRFARKPAAQPERPMKG